MAILSAIASLSNVIMNVDSSAGVDIATSLDVKNGSVLNLLDGSTLIFDKSTSLHFDSTSSMTIEGSVDVSFDLGDLELGSDLNYTLITFDDSADVSVVYTYLKDNLVVTYDGVEIAHADNTWELISDSNNIIIVGTVVPEPSTYAMIFGGVALGFAIYRRRK